VRIDNNFFTYSAVKKRSSLLVNSKDVGLATGTYFSHILPAENSRKKSYKMFTLKWVFTSEKSFEKTCS
jgi:hypothetical protein